jgi:hypothetical protein
MDILHKAWELKKKLKKYLKEDLGIKTKSDYYNKAMDFYNEYLEKKYHKELKEAEKDEEGIIEV